MARPTTWPARSNSVAFTTGQDIFFRSGAYNPQSSDGLHLLAHETAHTVQQSQGPVAGTPGPGGVSISSPSDRFEQAANRAADAALAGGRATVQPSGAGGAGGVSVQRVVPAAGAFLGVSAAAWSTAGTVVGIVSTVGGAAAGVASAVARGENKFASYVFPKNLMSKQDEQKLQQIAQFEIINQYVDRYLAANPAVRDQLTQTSGGGDQPQPAPTPAPAPAPTPAPTPTPAPGKEAPPAPPTGGPTSAQVDEAVMSAVKTQVERDLAAALENNLQSVTKEFMWSEGNTRGESSVGGTSGQEESAGVTGTLQLRNMQGVALKRTLTLSSDAVLAVGSVPGQGTEVIVHRFAGGSLGGHANWSAWDNLTVNVEGGQAQESIGPNGSPKLIVRTSWYWDQWGANSETYMEVHVHVGDDGIPVITATYEGTPGD